MNIFLSKLLTICMLFFISAVSMAQVKVAVNDTTYIYQQNPRLSDVLAPVAFEQQWYWPSSKLYKDQSSSVEKVRRDAIFSISNFAKDKDLDLSQVLSQVESWKLADRIKIPINFEHARFSLDKNPLFENGNYNLILAKRSTKIHFFGAMAQEQVVSYVDNACLSDYIPQLKKLKNAEHSFVYLLPNYSNNQDMLAIKAPVAYWNNQCVVPMPGSSIYVPLQENQMLRESARINQLIISLAQNRVVTL